jgi:hypothetical protein
MGISAMVSLNGISTASLGGRGQTKLQISCDYDYQTSLLTLQNTLNTELILEMLIIRKARFGMHEVKL